MKTLFLLIYSIQLTNAQVEFLFFFYFVLYFYIFLDLVQGWVVVR